MTILFKPDLSQWSREDLEARCLGARREMRVLRPQLDQIREIHAKLCKSYMRQWKRFTVADEELARREKTTILPPYTFQKAKKQAKSLLETISEMSQTERESMLRRLKEIVEEDAWEDIEEEKEDANKIEEEEL